MVLKLTEGIYCFAMVFITAVICRYFTHIGMESFYGVLELPDTTPPNHIFSYIWGAIYFLLFLSFFITLDTPKTKEQFADANALFVAQFFLQILWTFSFFYMEQLWASAAVIILLDMVVALLLHTVFFINKGAFVLLVPYLLWLLFATYLNVFLIFLN